jgi:isochorismate hydrolase
MKRHPQILDKNKTALLIVDLQERIIPAMLDAEMIVLNAVKLINGCKILGVPVYCTEQYPKGLGSTEPRIKSALKEVEAISKMSFSCIGAGELFFDLKHRNIHQVIVSGVESHVCVQQTVLDLLSNDFQVDVAADAVSSRKKLDYETALNRMRSNGAEVTSTESILFELLNACGTDEFKAISKLVK